MADVIFTDIQLETIKSHIESGDTLFVAAGKENIQQIAPLRKQLFDKYGRETVIGLISKNRPNSKRDFSAIPTMIQRMATNITAEQADLMIANLQDAIVQLNTIKSDLTP